MNRGFASHVGFLGGSETYSHGGGDANVHKGSHDLWDTLQPATDVVPTMDYATDYYGARAVSIIEDAGRSWRRFREASATANATTQQQPDPFFMYLAIQNVHTP